MRTPPSTVNRSDNPVTGKSPEAGARPQGSSPKQFSSEGAKRAPQARSVYSLPPDHRSAPGSPVVMEKMHGDNILRQVNSARSNMHGVNAKPFPQGHVSVNHDGSLDVKALGGRNYQIRPDGTLASYSERDRKAVFGIDGRIRSLRSDGIEIQRGPHNERKIITVRPDKSMLVSTGPRSGYLQTTVVRGDKIYMQRTYAEYNSSYTRVYGNYSYRGVAMQYFVPQAYYAPEFYGWAYQPWRTPVNYSWGWQRDPWYDYYGGYFAPQPVYSNSALWLTDFLMAETLRCEYLRRDEESAARQVAPSDAPITPEVKAIIAREVKQQLAREREAAEYPERAASYGELSTAMRDPRLLFVVSDSIEVNSGVGVCGLTAGDVLQLNGPPARGAQAAEVLVLNSKSGDCSAHTLVAVPFNDLQEMHNSMRERLYNGLEILRQTNGSNGIPPAPMAALSPPTMTEAAGLGSSDENVLAVLKSQRDEADQAEQQVIQSAFTEEQTLPGKQKDGEPKVSY